MRKLSKILKSKFLTISNPEKEELEKDISSINDCLPKPLLISYNTQKRRQTSRRNKLAAKAAKKICAWIFRKINKIICLYETPAWESKNGWNVTSARYTYNPRKPIKTKTTHSFQLCLVPILLNPQLSSMWFSPKYTTVHSISS